MISQSCAISRALHALIDSCISGKPATFLRFRQLLRFRAFRTCCPICAILTNLPLFCDPANFCDFAYFARLDRFPAFPNNLPPSALGKKIQGGGPEDRFPRVCARGGGPLPRAREARALCARSVLVFGIPEFPVDFAEELPTCHN